MRKSFQSSKSVKKEIKDEEYDSSFFTQEDSEKNTLVKKNVLSNDRLQSVGKEHSSWDVHFGCSTLCEQTRNQSSKILDSSTATSLKKRESKVTSTGSKSVKKSKKSVVENFDFDSDGEDEEEEEDGGDGEGEGEGEEEDEGGRDGGREGGGVTSTAAGVIKKEKKEGNLEFCNSSFLLLNNSTILTIKFITVMRIIRLLLLLPNNYNHNFGNLFYFITPSK